MLRKVHPSRPSASPCCFFSSLKTLLIPPEAINLLVGVNVPDDYLMAGFEMIMNGRFWVITEASSGLLRNGKNTLCFLACHFVSRAEIFQVGRMVVRRTEVCRWP